MGGATPQCPLQRQDRVVLRRRLGASGVGVPWLGGGVSRREGGGPPRLGPRLLRLNLEGGEEVGWRRRGPPSPQAVVSFILFLLLKRGGGDLEKMGRGCLGGDLYSSPFV